MYKSLILPTSILVGAIIGAGIFALPFIFAKAGIAVGLFYLIIFSFVFVLIHLMYADVVAKTEGEHRFPGYAKIYLGQSGFWLAILTGILEMLLILTAYLILAASFLNLILPAGGNYLADIFKIMIFWCLSSLAIFMGVKKMAFSAFLTTSGVVLIAILIFIFGGANFGKISSFPLLNLKDILLPYGVVLFALAGRVAIPTVINYFQKIKQPLKQAAAPIIGGTLLSAFVFLLFAFGVLGLSGTVSEDAVSGMINHASPLILLLIGIFGLISLWDSYILVGLDVKNSLWFDLKFPKIIAGLAVVVLPLILYFCGVQEFLALIGFIGGFFIAGEGVIIILMWLKSLRRKTERIFLQKLSPAIAYILILVFIGGMIYKLIY